MKALTQSPPVNVIGGKKKKNLKICTAQKIKGTLSIHSITHSVLTSDVSICPVGSINHYESNESDDSCTGEATRKQPSKEKGFPLRGLLKTLGFFSRLDFCSAPVTTWKHEIVLAAHFGCTDRSVLPGRTNKRAVARMFAVPTGLLHEES